VNNTVLNVGAGGDSIVTVDLSTFTAYPTIGKLPASCLYVSADIATEPAPVSDANPLPIGGSVAVSNFPASQTIAGTVAVSNFPAFPLTQDVAGTVDVGNFPATQTVAGTVAVSNLPATQPVSGTVTANAGTGTFGVSGTVAVSNFPATQPVSGTVALAAGAASIGTIANAAFGVTGALPAGTNLLGSTAAGLRYDTLYGGTTPATIRFAAVSLSASGTIVAAVATKKITVLKWSLWAASAVDVKFQSSTGSVDLTGALPYAGTGKGPLGSGAFCPVGHFQTAAGDALNLNLSAGVLVTGYLAFIQEP
jgi:hypothetical protein